MIDWLAELILKLLRIRAKRRTRVQPFRASRVGYPQHDTKIVWWRR